MSPTASDTTEHFCNCGAEIPQNKVFCDICEEAHGKELDEAVDEYKSELEALNEKYETRIFEMKYMLRYGRTIDTERYADLGEQYQQLRDISTTQQIAQFVDTFKALEVDELPDNKLPAAAAATAENSPPTLMYSPQGHERLTALPTEELLKLSDIHHHFMLVIDHELDQREDGLSESSCVDRLHPNTILRDLIYSLWKTEQREQQGGMREFLEPIRSRPVLESILRFARSSCPFDELMEMLESMRMERIRHGKDKDTRYLKADLDNAWNACRAQGPGRAQPDPVLADEKTQMCARGSVCSNALPNLDRVVFTRAYRTRAGCDLYDA
ncbi:hypothetical protein F4778DRAFT_792759 [Xylariomycetidae sp. FL2044]|nr:hypothetical protein F4778DRAFT_792759 [Xylariomycetidae sp. FL2044]